MRRLWSLLLMLLSACAALQAPHVPPGEAEVFFYRRALPIGPATIHIFGNDKDLGALPGGTFLDLRTNPGPRVFKAVVAGKRSIPYGTTLAGGNTYYFQVYLLGDQVKGIPTLAPMDAATASAEMKALKPPPPPN